ncbi:hypothetical protein KC352_g13901, partial [Hortaea werneckii]
MRRPKTTPSRSPPSATASTTPVTSQRPGNLFLGDSEETPEPVTDHDGFPGFAAEAALGPLGAETFGGGDGAERAAAGGRATPVGGGEGGASSGEGGGGRDGREDPFELVEAFAEDFEGLV